MRFHMMFIAVVLMPAYANACSPGEVTQLVAALKRDAGLTKEEFPDTVEQTPMGVTWKLFKRTDGTLQGAAHIARFDTYRQSDKLAIIDKNHYAVKEEIYNYIEPAQSDTAPDTAAKTVQTYFFCNGEVYAPVADKAAYTRAAHALRDEFFAAPDLAALLTQSGLR